MKKMIFVLGMTALLLFSGCGSKSDVPENQNDTESQEIVEETIEAEVTETDTFVVSDEIKEAELGSCLIQIGNEIVRFPIKVSELTELTDATYRTVGYEPDIMGNDYMVSHSDGAVIAGLFFEDANCSATYESFVGENTTAGNLYTDGLRDIYSEYIVFPKGIKIGMSYDEVKNIFGDALWEAYSSDSNVLAYKVRFEINDEEAIECCNESWDDQHLTIQKECSGDFVGFLNIDIDRNTGTISELMVSYGYDAANN